MANFTVTDPESNQTVTLSSEDNTPPTEAELNDVFSKINPQRNNSASVDVSSIDPTVQAEIDSRQKGKSSSKKGGVQEIIPGLARGVVQGGQGILGTGVNS